MRKRESLQNNLVMLVKGPLWFTRWAHDVGVGHRDLCACAGESPASRTPSTSLLDLNTLLTFHGKVLCSADHSRPDQTSEQYSPVPASLQQR